MSAADLARARREQARWEVARDDWLGALEEQWVCELWQLPAFNDRAKRLFAAMVRVRPPLGHYWVECPTVVAELLAVPEREVAVRMPAGSRPQFGDWDMYKLEE